MLLQYNNIKCAICLNKADLKTEADEKVLDIYRKIKIPVVETSTIDSTGLENLKEILRGKQAIFVGHSGVGKSSLTNALMNTDEIKTSHVAVKRGIIRERYDSYVRILNDVINDRNNAI